VGAFYRRIDRAVLTDVTVDWNGLAVTDTVPAAIPDLFVGQPLVISGHYAQPGSAVVTVRGVQAGREVSFEVPVNLPARDAARPAVATVWARARISELSRKLLRRPDSATRDQIIGLALSHRLMTRYTAFVAVDRSRVTAGGDADKMVVPVEVPESVRGISPSGMAYGGGGSGYGGGGGAYSFGSASVGYGYGEASGRGRMVARVVTPPQVRIGNATVTGDLDKNIIRRYLRRKLPAIRYCYEKQLRANPELEGTVIVNFTIQPSGEVEVVAAAGLGDVGVEQCIASAVGQIAFPAVNSGGLIKVRYPFHLRLGDTARVDKAIRNHEPDEDVRALFEEQP